MGTTETPKPKASRRRRWLRRLAVLAIVFAGLFLARGTLLREFAGLLVMDESAGAADAFAARKGDVKFDEAARRYHAHAAKTVLVFHDKPERVVAAGLAPDKAASGRARLTRLGVPNEAVTELGHADRDLWEGVRLVGEWLRANPHAVADLSCKRFESRRARVVADRVLGPDAVRVRIVPLPYRRFGDAYWWHGDEGRREVFVQATRLAYALAVGERSAPWPNWDADAYEAGLR